MSGELTGVSPVRVAGTDIVVGYSVGERLEDGRVVAHIMLNQDGDQ